MKSFYDDIKDGSLVKSVFEVLRWLWKKFDIRGVVFFEVSRLYMWYVEELQKTYNDVDRTFYESIKDGLVYKTTRLHARKIMDMEPEGETTA